MVFSGVIGGDSPEVESFEAFFFRVENRGRKEGDGRGEFFVGGVGGGLHIKTSFILGVIEEEGSGDNFILVFDEIEGSERHFELVFKVSGRESPDALFFREFGLDFYEVFYVFRIGRDADGETLFREGIIAGSSSLGEVF